MNVWHPLRDARVGYFFDISESIRIVERNNANLLNPVSDSRLILASDYSGQHKEATHEAYAFLVTTSNALTDWIPLLSDFRKSWLPDGRRMAFKSLNEPVRWRALPAFLELFDRLPGNLLTIMVDRRVGSFMHGGTQAIIEAFPDCFDEHSKSVTVEKMFCLSGFVALIFAGLRDEGQGSNWISDHDEALDSHQRREQFARLAAYLSFGFSGWKKPADSGFGTTNSLHAPIWVEDITALPDLVAGAYCALSNFLPSFLGAESWRVTVPIGFTQERRSQVIGNWLAGNRGMLRHVLVRLEQDDNGNVRSSAQAFFGTGAGV